MGGDDAEDAWERGVERVGDGAGAEPGAASSVIQAGKVRPRPLPAIVEACEDERDEERFATGKACKRCLQHRSKKMLSVRHEQWNGYGA